jgi:hypothetical protein
MAGHGEKKDRRKEAAIAALIAEGTIPAAAAAAKVGERTLRRWLAEDADFRADYRRARTDAFEGTIALAQKASGVALATLYRNLTCGRPSCENQAALAIIELSVKGVQLLDLEARLAALEGTRPGSERGGP